MAWKTSRLSTGPQSNITTAAAICSVFKNKYLPNVLSVVRSARGAGSSHCPCFSKLALSHPQPAVSLLLSLFAQSKYRWLRWLMSRYLKRTKKAPGTFRTRTMIKGFPIDKMSELVLLRLISGRQIDVNTSGLIPVNLLLATQLHRLVFHHDV